MARIPICPSGKLRNSNIITAPRYQVVFVVAMTLVVIHVGIVYFKR